MKFLIHLMFQSRKIRKEIKQFAKRFSHKKILEIGSGKNPSDNYFDDSNEFTGSDLPSIDVTTMLFIEKYDIIVCINVLDDVFNYQVAVDNIYRALKKHGEVFLITVGFYPIHDIPNDYFRFTEFSLRKIFSKFREVEIKTIGLKRFPSYYILTAKKF